MIWVWLSRATSQCKSREFKDALAEVAVTVVTATLPIWFFPLIGLILVSAAFASSLLNSSVSNGEFFLFCTSIVGPLLYTLFRIYEVPHSERLRFKYRISLVFPHGLKFAILVFFICIISAIIFGLQKINPNFSGAEISKSGYVYLSVALFAVSVAGFFIALVFRNQMDNYSPAERMRRDEDEFARQFRAESH